MSHADIAPIGRADVAKVLVRLPHSLHDQLRVRAAEEGISINTLIAVLLAGGIGFTLDDASDERTDQVKNYVVTYQRPGKPDLPLGNCKLHAPDCRYLKPTRSRPYTGGRK